MAVIIRLVKFFYTLFISHHITLEKTEASLKGLCIKEITTQHIFLIHKILHYNNMSNVNDNNYASV